MIHSQLGQAELLLCSCLFCLVMALCVYLSNNFDSKKRRWLLFIQIFTALLLFNDALAYMFRGHPGTVGFYMVRISNFLVFALSDVILFFFHVYVCSYLFADGNWRDIRRAKIVSYICAAGVAFVVLS